MFIYGSSLQNEIFYYLINHLIINITISIVENKMRNQKGC
jgi:hypothetical protein